MPRANDLVKGKDLADQRIFIKNNVASQTVLSPFIISGTSSILRFVDTNGEDFEIQVDGDIMSIVNLTGPITFVRFRGAANDDIQFDRPVVFNSTITLPEDIVLSGASPSITMTDTGGDDLILTVDADVATFNFGGNNHIRLRGAANDDIQIDRATVFNANATFIDITLTDTSPTITFDDTNGDNFTITVDGNVMTITNLTSGGTTVINARGVLRFYPRAYSVNGGTTGNVGGGLDTLHSFTIGIGDLTNDGDYLKCRFGGSFASNDNDKRIQISVGGQVVDNQALFDQDSGNWCYDLMLIRANGGTQLRFSLIGVWGLMAADGASSFAGNGRIFGGSGIITVSDLDSNTCLVAVQAEGTANDDIVQSMTIAEICNLS